MVINVKQIGNYPASEPAPDDLVLVQRSGLGGPYMAVTAGALVSHALANQPQTGAEYSLSVGIPAPPNDAGGGVFSTYYSSLPGGGLRINNYDTFTDTNYLTSAPAANLGQDPATAMFRVRLAGAGSAGAPIIFNEVLDIDLAGNATLPLGTLTVARDPSAQGDVVTLRYLQANAVNSFNNRVGRVQLNAKDVYDVLCLDSAIATQKWTLDAINAGIGNLITTYPLVTCWNGRNGNVFLQLSDITTVFFQPGQQPLTQTPAADSNDFSIANTAWVTSYLHDFLTGNDPQGLATQSWVLANTVNAFNARQGPVTLTLTDVTQVGGAPVTNPAFNGIPTAPTATPGTNTGQIATTAFVHAAMTAGTAGVASFNTRQGAVTLNAADVTQAGGAPLDSPALTGTPTAPTAIAGTSNTQLATTQFVQAAIGSGAVASFNTRQGAVTLTLADVTGVGGAPIVSPNFSSVPTAPTAPPGTNSVQLATTAFVTQAVTTAGGVSSFNSRTGAITLVANDISAAGGLVNPSVALTGTPTATTATQGDNTTRIATTAFVMAALSTGAVSSFNTRQGAVTLNVGDITGAGGAALNSPNFTGTPTAPTATVGTSNTQIASTAFVQAAVAAGTAGVASFNTRTGAVTLLAADVTAAGGAMLASPAFSGTPTAPTAAPGTSSTQLATTAFVAAALGSGIAEAPNDGNAYMRSSLGWMSGGTITQRLLVNGPTATNPGVEIYSGATLRIRDPANSQWDIYAPANQLVINNTTVGNVLVIGRNTGTVQFNYGIFEKQVVVAGTNLDLSTANVFSRTATANLTFTVSNVPTSGNVASFILDLTNGGAFTMTWWAGVRWPGGSAPTLTASGRDVLGFFTYDGGATWNGLVLGKGMA